MDIYSLALGGAVIAVVVALVSCLIGTMFERDRRHIGADIWRRVGTLAAAATLGLVLLASFYHLGSAHSAGSGAELGFGDFLTEHPALPLVGALAFVALWWAGQTSR